jgi:hypothetical protein
MKSATALGFAVCFCIGLLAAPAPAAAGGPPSFRLEMPDSEASELQRVMYWMERDARAYRVWWPGWLGFSALLTGAQVVLAIDAPNQVPSGDLAAIKSYRGRMIVGASMAAVGTLSIALAAPPTWGVRGLRRDLALGEISEAEALAIATSRLTRSARSERAAREFFAHFLGVAFNVAGSLVVALALDSSDEAFVNLLAGVAISEAMIWTRPRAADIAVHRYRVGVDPAGLGAGQ